MAHFPKCSLPEHPRFLTAVAAFNLLVLVLAVIAVASRPPASTSSELRRPTTRFLMAQNSNPVAVTITAGSHPTFFVNRLPVRELAELPAALAPLREEAARRSSSTPIAVILRDPAVPARTEQDVIRIIQKAGFQCALADIPSSDEED